MGRDLPKEEIEFLRESNHIEGEYSKIALTDAKKSWIYGKIFMAHGGKIDTVLIRRIHNVLMKRLNPRIAGNIREVDVQVGGRICIPWSEIKEELRLLCNPGIYPILSESLIKRWHIEFEKIHPFEDGNGRVGRIIMNLQRIKMGLPILIIHEGEEQYEYYKWFK